SHRPDAASARCHHGWRSGGDSRHPQHALSDGTTQKRTRVMTIRETLRSATERLELHHVSNAQLTAEVLLVHSVSVYREHLNAHDDRGLTDEEAQTLKDFVYCRIGGAPLQYIVERQKF